MYFYVKNHKDSVCLPEKTGLTILCLPYRIVVEKYIVSIFKGHYFYLGHLYYVQSDDYAKTEHLRI